MAKGILTNCFGIYRANKKKIGPKSGFLSLCGMEAWNVSGFLIEVISA